MKPKILYAAMLLICMGLFTSAKQTIFTSTKQTNCLSMADIVCNKMSKAHTVQQKDDPDKTFDLSPLRHFIFFSAISN